MYNILTRESRNDFGDGRKTNMRLDGKRNTSVEHPLQKIHANVDQGKIYYKCLPKLFYSTYQIANKVLLENRFFNFIKIETEHQTFATLSCKKKQ